MRKKISLPFCILIGIGVVSLFAGRVTYNGTVIESFDNAATKDPRSSVVGWGTGSIKLNTKTGIFTAFAFASYPAWSDCVTANDFDGDGRPDVIVTGSKYSNVLAFARNMGGSGQNRTYEIAQWIDGCTGSGGVPTFGFDGAIDASSYVSLTSGDYDNDGDIDFFFVAGVRSSPSSLKRIYLYRNQRVETSSLSFTRYDRTSSWASLLGGLGWTSPNMVSLDFDKDGDVDILYGNNSGNIVMMTNILADDWWGDEKFFVDTENPLVQTGWTGTGIQSLAVGDFDHDEDYDIVVGSLSYNTLELFRNDGEDIFASEIIETFTSEMLQGGVGVVLSDDLDNDKEPELFVGVTYPKGTTTPTAREVYVFNGLVVAGDGPGDYTRDLVGQLIFDGAIAGFGVASGFNFGALLDSNHDGNMDIIVGGMNFAAGSCGRVVLENASQALYTLVGEAVSQPVNPGLLGSKVVTQVELSEFTMGFIGSKNTGLKIVFYMSNDGGATWYLVAEYKDADLKYQGGSKKISFKTWGNELIFKAAFFAAEDVDKKKQPMGGSVETPRLDSLKIKYYYQDWGEFSRDTVATSTYKDAATTHRLVVAGSFYYPGVEGRLLAYDTSTMTFATDAYSLKTISETDFTAPATSYRRIIPAGVAIAWNAGDLLKNRTSNSRTIFTAIPVDEHDKNDERLQRLDFTVANASALHKFLKEKNRKTSPLIEFLRGKDRSWKLGAIDHSTPLIVGPPADNPDLKGTDYGSFRAQWITRPKVVFVGANDGMLHCFDFKTGAELWGFIPHNLLDNLKKMAKWEKKAGSYTFVFNEKHTTYYLDGNPTTADVFIDADGNGTKEWRTVLVCGQRKGSGKSSKKDGSNFYFALDVTDPADPRPLWEFSKKNMGETWSLPEIGKVRRNGLDAWVAFMGSGYNSKEDEVFGVDVETGKAVWSMDIGKIDSKTKVKIKKSVPASPRLVDMDQDGYADRMYIGDLFGRLWRTNLTPDPWTSTVVYTDKTFLPILGRPAVWINRAAGETVPHLYFGTGGDDSAPDDDLYSFIALIDGSTPSIDWIVGNRSDFSGLSSDKDMGDLGTGERVWADPVVSDDVVYFSTFKGDIEYIAIDETVDEPGHLYARYVVTSGSRLIGSSLFGGTQPSLVLTTKSRQAVVMGDLKEPTPGQKERDVYIQEVDSTLQALTRGGTTPKEPESLIKLIIKSWREIFQIIR